MSRSLCWQSLVPRLLFLAVVLLAAQFGLGLAARSIAMRSGVAAIGARVDVGNSRVSWWDRQVVLNDLRVADPRHSAENLVEADRCELDFAAQPLWHKQAIVNRGRISGLRFATLGSRETNSEGAKSATAPNSTWFRDEAEVVAGQWFAHLSERFQRDNRDQFESVQKTDAFCATWSTQSAALEARGQELDRRVAKLQEGVGAAQTNPLRNDKFLTELPKTIAQLQQDFAGLRGQLEKLPDQLETARRAIVAARRHDEELARTRLAVEPIEANTLSAYLLRAEAGRPLDELVGWLRWMRERVPAGPTKHPSQTRGEDILFAGCSATSNVLIRALELQGSARIASQPVELRGVLTNIATDPQLHNEPMRLHLQTTGSMPLELQATIDRTRGTSRDELLVDCQGVLLPKLSLGRPDQIGMTIAPSLGSLSVSLALDGEKLTGEIQMVQQNVRITPTVGGDFANVPIAGALEESLGHIESLATRVSLGGTLSEPSCTLWSNLGPAVAEAMDHAVQRAGGQHTRALLVDAGKQVDERLAGVERQMMEQQARLTAQITDVTARLQTVAAGEAPLYRISPDRLGRRLPNNSLFR